MNIEYRINFRPARIEDINYLINLRKETMSEHFHNSKVIHTMENIFERVKYPFDCANIILINGEKAGLLKVIKEGKEWDLCQIQIDKIFQGKGIGNQIISELIGKAKQEGAEIKLNVLKANPAKRLYERLGFAVTNEGEHFYEMKIN
jgi:ribosomal protein S18 acetylase RimI-like enzyme